MCYFPTHSHTEVPLYTETQQSFRDFSLCFKKTSYRISIYCALLQLEVILFETFNFSVSTCELCKIQIQKMYVLRKTIKK